MMLPSSVLNSLKDLSRQEGATLFMTLLSAFQTLLHRYTGQDDLIVGSPVAGRTHIETEGLIGFFVNTLVMRTNLSGNPTFKELLERMKQVALQGYAHQELPFDRLVEELKIGRDLSRTPIFQVMFNLENLPKIVAETHSIGIDQFELENQKAQFDLSLEIVEKADGLSCLFKYNSDLFDSVQLQSRAVSLRDTSRDWR